MNAPSNNAWPTRRTVALFGLAFFLLSFFCPVAHRETSLEGDRETFYPADLFTWLFSDPATVGLAIVLIGLNLSVAVLYIASLAYPQFPLLAATKDHPILAPLYGLFSIFLIAANVLVPAMFLTPIGLILFFGFIGSGSVFWFISVVSVQWVVRSSISAGTQSENSAHVPTMAV